MSSVSCSHLITIYLSLFFVNVRGGGVGGLKLFIFFKNVDLSGPGLCPVVRHDCKLQNNSTRTQQETQNLFKYQTLLGDSAGILGLWSSFLKYFWFIWVKMKMNQSKYWQEKVADSNSRNEKFSLFGTWDYRLTRFICFQAGVKIFILRSGVGNDKSCRPSWLLVWLESSLE